MGTKKIVKFEDGTVRRYEVFDDEPNGFIVFLKFAWFLFKFLLAFFPLLMISHGFPVLIKFFQKGQYAQVFVGSLMLLGLAIVSLVFTYFFFKKPIKATFEIITTIWDEARYILRYNYRRIANYLRQRKNR